MSEPFYAPELFYVAILLGWLAATGALVFIFCVGSLINDALRRRARSRARRQWPCPMTEEWTQW